MPQKRLPGINPKTNGFVARKRKPKLTRQSVLKMLAVMEASRNTNPPVSKDETTPPTPSSEDARPQDFLQSGRTGRRNALANILGEHAIVTSSDLPAQLEALTTKDTPENPDNNQASTSKS
ncbi:cAMP-dependent protein kinase inhibitor beta [Tribolium castaneum]|uniref:Uncharacterized protein n=2 Tax=Tribolium castaneum TaxID=7070 RepID=A0A139WIB3_TRICA|nr:PREDICTED: cAMP-dependent protein kinase inhibitor beta [Tribolium castaneum]KYB27672.1 hypothetical protein TcasGA2_TC013656 [Tribolium castaneum]|eukprot:XP_008193320.1 PREDICTED: cAMP-dependent protein kinase inhibitor beta [Tribolium castaneum]